MAQLIKENIKSRNIELHILQLAARLGFRFETDATTQNWQIAILYLENCRTIKSILKTERVNYERANIAKYGIWTMSQLILTDGKTMITWQQLKVAKSVEFRGRKPKWFETLERTIIENSALLSVRTEYRVMPQNPNVLVRFVMKPSIDQRKKECVVWQSKKNSEVNFGKVCKKGKNQTEVEAIDIAKLKKCSSNNGRAEISFVSGKVKVPRKELGDVTNIMGKGKLKINKLDHLQVIGWKIEKKDVVENKIVREVKKSFSCLFVRVSN
ncbi:29311_t:CDS:1 [Gigaspora margarita]|uniref:29311_t:CDS:1 n=1 Tax=Gigaspora margarita TaxID=4874 RepID=A0ABN7UDI7_GIGMA|nr:29311_t:CDS:1 [Gigaspora margarita]